MDHSLLMRSWSKREGTRPGHLLIMFIYIDNPVGLGLALTTDGFAEKPDCGGEDLSNVSLRYSRFLLTQDNDFFVTGESYAGKFTPAISYKIHSS